MDKFFEFLIKTGQADVKDDKLSIFGITGVFLPLSLLLHIQRRLEQNATEDILYVQAKKYVLQWIDSISKSGSIPLDKFVDWNPKVLHIAGWGTCTVHFDSSGVKVVFSQSNLAQMYRQMFGKSDHPVCHIVRGYIAAFAEKYFGKECTVEEIQCQAKGDPVCEFVVKQE